MFVLDFLCESAVSQLNRTSVRAALCFVVFVSELRAHTAVRTVARICQLFYSAFSYFNSASYSRPEL